MKGPVGQSTTIHHILHSTGMFNPRKSRHRKILPVCFETSVLTLITNPHPDPAHQIGECKRDIYLDTNGKSIVRVRTSVKERERKTNTGRLIKFPDIFFFLPIFSKIHLFTFSLNSKTLHKSWREFWEVLISQILGFPYRLFP